VGEDPNKELAFGIKFTPLSLSKKDYENGVDGSFILTEYTYDEKDEFEEDFENIIFALKN